MKENEIQIVTLEKQKDTYQGIDSLLVSFVIVATIYPRQAGKETFIIFSFQYTSTYASTSALQCHASHPGSLPQYQCNSADQDHKNPTIIGCSFVCLL